MKAVWVDKIGKKCFFVLLLAFLLVCVSSGIAQAFAVNNLEAEEGHIVYVVKIEERFSKTTATYIQRAMRAAENDNADYFLIEMDAVGGYDEYVKNVADLLMNCSAHTICYLDGRAYDGAALVALSCDTVIMSPSAAFGSVGSTAHEILGDPAKRVEWQNTFGTNASQNGHNAVAARNIVTMSLNGNTEQRGHTVTVTSNAAVSEGLADCEFSSLPVLLDDYGLSKGVIIQVEKNVYEHLVDTLANPIIATLLLAVGLSALLIEMLLYGYGITVWIGIPALILYFLGSCHSGIAESYVVFMMLGSVTLVLLEIFLSPGSSICGVLGIIGFIVSVILMAANFWIAVVQVIIIFVLVVILIMSNVKNEKSRNILKKLVLRDRTTTEEGYLSQPINIRDYLNAEGVALTALRPAGAVKIGSERVDVVTEGDFISAGDRVKVIKVDGSSVIVRKI